MLTEQYNKLKKYYEKKINNYKKIKNKINNLKQMPNSNERGQRKYNNANNNGIEPTTDDNSNNHPNA